MHQTAMGLAELNYIEYWTIRLDFELYKKLRILCFVDILYSLRGRSVKIVQ